MTTEGLIVSILSLSGLLIAIWIVLATKYVHERNRYILSVQKSHEKRIRALEMDMVEQIVNSEEILKRLDDVC